MKIGITGAAGFIGMHLTKDLLSKQHEVIGIDSLTPAYGGSWSKRRADNLKKDHNFDIKVIDLAEVSIEKIVETFQDCEVIVHLAAWPGVRQGQLLPSQYAKNNITAFSRVLESIRIINPSHFMYASSSSVYGDLASEGPVKESMANGLNLRSYYAATKWINETEARASQDLINFPTTALRFFTVYGPWGRPDMAYWDFIKKIKNGEVISLYGESGGSRNFTYIADSIEIITQLIATPLSAQHREINIACGEPDETIDFLNLIAIAAKKDFTVNIVERPSVDVEKTWADLKKISELIKLPLKTPLSIGVESFVSWYEGIDE